MRIISKPLAPPGQILPHFQPHFSMAPLASNKPNINIAIKVPVLLRSPTLKPSFRRTSEAHKP